VLTTEERKDEIAHYRDENPVGTLASHEIAALLKSLKVEFEALGNDLIRAYPVLVSAEELHRKVHDETTRIVAEGGEGTMDVGSALESLLEATDTFLKAGGLRS
jgi:hypothetical protein